jgi:RHS repeat-associated protein
LLTAERIEEKRFAYDETASGRSVYNYYRDYDPTTGRYLQPDPIGLAARINLYSYVGSNPLRFVDPFGLVRGPFHPDQVVEALTPRYWKTQSEDNPPRSDRHRA